MDPAELRRKNFIPTTAFPYQTPVALQYDSGNYPPIIDEAMKIADYKGFEARRAEAKSRGKLRGIGFSSYIEACGLAPSQVIGPLGGGVGQWESAQIKFNPTGNVQVMTGAHSHGQGHETTFAQIIHDKLGVPMDQIEIVHGDTATTPFGMGTYGSRSLAVGGSAIVKATDKIIAKGKKIAAHLMEAVGGRRRVRERHLQGGRHGQDRAARRRRCSPPTCRTTIRWRSSSPAWTRTPSTIRRTSSIRPARRSARSRSTPTPASSRSSTTPRSTISATSSIR